MSFLFNKELLLLLTLWTGIFCNYACYSIIAPFFPQLARKKGLTAEQYSLVFGMYSLSQVIFSCVIGKSLMKIGAKFIVVSGLFLTGGSTILFGCLEKCPGGSTFFWLCMAVRAVEGAGFAAYLTSALAIIVRTFPTNPGYYVGLTETIVTIAMISGPPLGSLLYTTGGYIAPFVSFGAVIVIMSIISNLLITERGSDLGTRRKEPESLTLAEYGRLLRLPAGAMVLVSVTCNVTADAFILISLSDHLIQFHLKPIVVGCVYLCLFLSYGLSSPIAGKIADKMGGEFLMQSVGSVIVAAAFCLIGPGSFLTIKPTVGLIVCGLLLKGLGAGPLISCSYSAALRAARRSGLPDDFRTYSLVSTLVSFSIPLGNLIGGVTTGVMYERLGMSLSTTIYAGIFIFLTMSCLASHFLERYIYVRKYRMLKWKRRKRNLEQGEELPLVQQTNACCKNIENGFTSNHHGVFTFLEKDDGGSSLLHEEPEPLCRNGRMRLEWLNDASQAKNIWLS